MGRAKILVIRGGAIGDFILTLPAIAALRRHFPNAELDVLGYPKIASLALQSKLLDNVRNIESRQLAGFFASRGDLAKDLCEYFSGFEIIISYLYDPDEIFRANITRCSSAQFIQGPHRPDEREKIHAASVFLKPLERLAIFNACRVPELRKRSDNSALANKLALHPGSGSEAKNWPESHWKELLKILVTATGLNFLLVGGEAEEACLDRLASDLPSARMQIAQNLPLTELADRLHNCTGFVGHDSGITHIAAALGLPCLALWADTEVSVWQPLGDRVSILRDPAGIRALTAERVAEEVARICSSSTTASRQSS